MNTIRRIISGAAAGLRDLQIRLCWKMASVIRGHAYPDGDPDGDEFGQFLRQAGKPTDPDRDEDMMPYWLVSRRVPGPRLPEALESAYFRFRGRRQRDPERARMWRGYILRWAEMQTDAPEARPFHEETDAEDPILHAASLPTIRPPAFSGSGGRPTRHLRHLVAAVAVMAAVGLGTWVVPSLRPAARTDLPSVSALGIEQLERGSKSLVEQALRARYIETLHQVQRMRISSVGDGMDFERILLEGARLDVERAIQRHRRAGRVPPRLYLLLGKLSLLTEFETEGRRALARAANHGGTAGAEARELLHLLSE